MIDAIPPPELPGSGSRVKRLWRSSQPGNTELPVLIFHFEYNGRDIRLSS